MRDPFSWSLPIGRIRGITVRVHILLIIVFLGLYLRVAFDSDQAVGAGLEWLIFLGMLFVAVLLHEFGHCYGAHLVDGEAREILGVADVQVADRMKLHRKSNRLASVPGGPPERGP